MRFEPFYEDFFHNTRCIIFHAKARPVLEVYLYRESPLMRQFFGEGITPFEIFPSLRGQVLRILYPGFFRLKLSLRYLRHDYRSLLG